MSQRIRELDGLRAIAVGLVFLVHGAPDVFPGGWVGVDLFFVISGFVITRTLIRDSSLKTFFLKRVWRILPPLLALCFVAISFGESGLNVTFSALSVMNWARAVGVTDGGMLGHTWSLAVEEQFYLIWPLAFLILKRPVPVLIAVAAAICVWRLNFTDEMRIYSGSDTHSEGLVLGCLLAFTGNIFPKCSLPIPMTIMTVIVFTGPTFAIGIPIASMASFWIVSILSEQRFVALDQAFLQWAGSRSYSLYLWHFPVFQLYLQDEIEPQYALTLAIFTTGIVAELSWRYLENMRYRLEDLIRPTLPTQKQGSNA